MQSGDFAVTDIPPSFASHPLGESFGSCSCIAHKSVGVIIKERISVDKERIAQCRLLLVVSLRAQSPNTRKGSIC